MRHLRLLRYYTLKPLDAGALRKTQDRRTVTQISGRSVGSLRLKSRLDHLERRIGKEECECRTERHEILHVDVGEPVPPATLCPKCNSSMPRFVVRYVTEGKLAGCG